ncbi:uncharacterized protein LOC124645010 isoform X1 [Helicoverpa zea]|uniref:uncharacterized protein LOC124645010 isoform X1 n=1 Tax=Helicoverpa zea TaxID=7113 RepID=UPI001F57DEDD|nr:uncharacterized protein LOC124645010 isoform X1 [Helicoverpa zea]
MDEISLSTIQALERIPLEQLIETYIKMSVEVIKEMQNRDDPEFLRSLKYAKSQMTREEFLSIQIEVYAACNQFAMQQCTVFCVSAVDQIAHMVVLHDSVSLMDL